MGTNDRAPATPTLSREDKHRILTYLSRIGDLGLLADDADFKREFPMLRLDVESGELWIRVADIGAADPDNPIVARHVARRRLRDAAPDLLAALKKLLAWSTSEYQSHPGIDAEARAAIAKAES